MSFRCTTTSRGSRPPTYDWLHFAAGRASEGATAQQCPSHSECIGLKEDGSVRPNCLRPGRAKFIILSFRALSGGWSKTQLVPRGATDSTNLSARQERIEYA